MTSDADRKAAYDRYLEGFNPDDKEKRDAALKEIERLAHEEFKRQTLEAEKR